MNIGFSVLLLACLASPWPAAAANARQDFHALRAQAAGWLEQQAAQAFPGVQAQARMGGVDERLRFPACPEPQFFLPAGSRLWGNGSLGVRCQGEAPWSLYLSYENRLRGPALVTARPLPARHAPAMGDVALQVVDYRQSPDTYPRELPPAARLSRPLAAGQPILIDMLVLPNVIQAGKKIQVRYAGSGFDVSQEGLALNSAAPGEAVKARMPFGRVVHGTATREGQMTVSP